MTIRTVRKYRPLEVLVSVLLLVISSLLMTSCSEEETAEEAETFSEPVDEQIDEQADEQEQVESAKEAIQAVITEMFTAPNEELNRLNEQADELYEKDPYTIEEEYIAFMESPERQAIDNYMEETYAPYFTVNGYENQRTNGFSLSYALTGLGEEIQATVSSIEVNQSDRPTAEKNYHFSFTVNYINTEGVTEPYRFEGMAIVPQKGKIGDIQFTDKDGLLEQISKDRNRDISFYQYRIFFIV